MKESNIRNSIASPFGLAFGFASRLEIVRTGFVLVLVLALTLALGKKSR